MKTKYKFLVGIAGFRTVTVTVDGDEEDAMQRAWHVLNRRAEKNGNEAPVGWTLRLLEKSRVR